MTRRGCVLLLLLPFAATTDPDPDPFRLSAQPFLARAEQEKLEYEAARKRYEEGAMAIDFGTSISFSVLPGNSFHTSPIPLSNSAGSSRPGSSAFTFGSSTSVKAEPVSSESESEADPMVFRKRA